MSIFRKHRRMKERQFDESFKRDMIKVAKNQSWTVTGLKFEIVKGELVVNGNFKDDNATDKPRSDKQIKKILAGYYKEIYLPRAQSNKA